MTLLQSRRGRATALLASLAIAASPLATVAPAHAADTLTVSGKVFGNDENPPTGLYTSMWACPVPAAAPSFDAGGCSNVGEQSINWYADGEDGFTIADFPAGQYLVAGPVDDPYGDYEPRTVGATPLTANTTGLTVTLTARPEIEGLRATLSPRQPIAGQEVTITVTGAPEGSILEYQWPGDTDEDEDLVPDHLHSTTYTVPASEIGNDWYAGAYALKPGYRRTFVDAPAPYPVWASESAGGRIVGTITDPGGLIESAEDIDLSLCNETGTGIGIAGSHAYQVVDNGDGTFSYEVIVPVGEFCLEAVVDFPGGQDILLASQTNPNWDEMESTGYPGAQKFTVGPGSTTTINLTFVHTSGEGELPKLTEKTAPTLSTMSPKVGQKVTLLSEPTFVEGTPDSITYYWQLSDGSSWVGGAVGPEYTPISQHIGRFIRLVAEVEKQGYESWSYVWQFPSAVVTAAAGVTLTGAQPTISGTATVGKTLTANPGAWAPAGVTLAYQWYAGATAITGATARTLKLAPAHLGSTITVRVTGTLSGATPVTRESRATGKVQPAAFPQGSITRWATKVTGKVKVGKTISVKAPKVGVPGAKVTYQWYAGGVALKGATTNKLRLAKALKGKAVVVKVSVVKVGYQTVSKKVAAGKVKK